MMAKEKVMDIANDLFWGTTECDDIKKMLTELTEAVSEMEV